MTIRHRAADVVLTRERPTGALQTGKIATAGGINHRRASGMQVILISIREAVKISLPVAVHILALAGIPMRRPCHHVRNLLHRRRNSSARSILRRRPHPRTTIRNPFNVANRPGPM
jgi:hypothetical protein